MSTIRELVDHAMSRPDPPAIFEVGQTVRIKSTLKCDTHMVLDMLGASGTVESVSISPITKWISYKVRVGNRVEIFDEDELDRRYAMNTR